MAPTRRSPAKVRAVRREQAIRQWADPATRDKVLRNRALGVVRAAVKRDPAMADAIIAIATATRDT